MIRRGIFTPFHLLTGQSKYGLGQPVSKRSVVLKLLEQLRVIFGQRCDHSLERLIVLDPGRARRVLQRI